MHPVEEYQNIIALTMDRLNECEIVRPTRRRWTLNYYITQFTGNSISWISDDLETRCGRKSQHPAEWAPRSPIEQWQLGIRRVGEQTSWEKMLDWGTCPREAGTLSPRLNSPGKRERNADGHKSGGQYVAVLFGLQLPLTHNPFK